MSCRAAGPLDRQRRIEDVCDACGFRHHGEDSEVEVKRGRRKDIAGYITIRSIQR
jgi:hypothetical protein